MICILVMKYHEVLELQKRLQSVLFSCFGWTRPDRLPGNPTVFVPAAVAGLEGTAAGLMAGSRKGHGSKAR